MKMGLKCTLFQGMISNWTIHSKAVSWTGVAYSFLISTSIKQVKVLELIISVLFAFGSCCCEPTLCGQTNSLYKWNRQLLGFKNKTKPSEVAGTLEVAKSTVWYIQRKKEHAGELSNIKRPGYPLSTTVVDDQRILSMVKKNPFTTSSQVKNTLQEVCVSLSKSTIKRWLHESKYRGFTTRPD